MISADRDWGGNSLHAFFTKCLEAVVRRECIRDRARYHAADAMRPSSFLHPGRDIDRIAIDTNRAFGVALLAHHDVAAVNTDAKLGRNAKRAHIGIALPRDRSEHLVDGTQDGVVTDCRIPIQIAIRPSPL